MKKHSFPSRLKTASNLDKLLMIKPPPTASSSQDDKSEFSDSIAEISLAESWTSCHNVFSKDKDSLLSVTGPQTKFVLASQFRSNLKIPVGCINCDESKYKASKERAVNRKLKLKITKLEESLSHNSRNQKIDHLLFSSSEKLHNNDEFINKIQNLQTSLHSKQAELDILRKSWQEYRLKIETNANQFNSEMSDLKSKLKNLKLEYESVNSSRDTLLFENENLMNHVNTIKSQLEISMNSQNISKNSNILHEFENLKIEHNNLIMKNKTCNEEIINMQNLSIKHSHAYSQAQNEINKLKNMIEDLSKKLNDSNKTNELLIEENNLLKLEQERERSNSRNLNSDNEKLKMEINNLSLDNELKYSHMNKLKEEINNIKLQSQKDYDKYNKNLEKIIPSSVRLCIVAPTVNVNVAEEKLTIQSKYSVDKLNVFMQDLLNEYSFLYRQDSSDMGPDGMTTMKEWLENTMIKMRKSIEDNISQSTSSDLDVPI